MKESEFIMKSIDWKNIGWRSIQVGIVLLLNGCGIAILIMLFLDDSGLSEYGELLKQMLKDKEISKDAFDILFKEAMQGIDVESLFEGLEFKQKAGIILGEVIGAGLSGIFIKFLYQVFRDDKRAQKQTELIGQAIEKGSNNESKQQRDINKYL